jgi:hypothetical protein
MTNCTWKGCSKPAKHQQTAKDGEEWANLCDEHNAELERSISGPAPVVLRCWVLAGGGAEKMAARMVR